MKVIQEMETRLITRESIAKQVDERFMRIEAAITQIGVRSTTKRRHRAIKSLDEQSCGRCQRPSRQLPKKSG